MSKSITNKKGAFKKYLFCKSDANWTHFKRERNKARKIVRKARHQFEVKIASELKTNPKSFWKYIKGKKIATTSINRLKQSDGSIITNNLEMATCLNNFFSSIFTESKESTPNKLYDVSSKCPILSNIVITKETLLKYLNAIKTDTSPGPDDILPKILFELRKELAYPLSKLFSMSLQTSSVPYDWKLATISPIFKKGKRDEPSNYRPISLTSVVSKLMEKIIRQAIVNHLESNSLLSDNQYGFLSGRSCTLQLLTCIELWTSNLDKGIPMDILYTDFQKAFDTVPHNLLFLKLKKIGIHGKVFSWLKDFLTGRKQRVRISNSLSSWKDVRSGVPQGSVIGPTLFLIFINDLPSCIETADSMLFADDAKMCLPINGSNSQKIFQSEINNVVNWSNNWKLGMNLNKCKVLHLGNQNPNFDYSMNSKSESVQLNSVNCEKDLGVYIDSQLNFKEHVGKSVSSANKMIGLVRRNFKNLGKEVFSNLYKSLIRPKLEYASPVWNSLSLREKRLLEGVQRRATKLIPTLGHLTYPERLLHLGLPTLEYRRVRADLLQVYKIFHGIDKINPNKFFEIAPTTSTRGHSFKIYKQRPNTNIRKHSFSFRVVDTWNSLPKDVVEASSINLFKSRLNSHWYSHPFKFRPSFL